MQLWNGWDASKGQPLYNPCVLTMLERVLAAPGVGFCSSLAPGGALACRVHGSSSRHCDQALGLHPAAGLQQERGQAATPAAEQGAPPRWLAGCRAFVTRRASGIVSGPPDSNPLGAGCISAQPATQMGDTSISEDSPLFELVGCSRVQLIPREGVGQASMVTSLCVCGDPGTQEWA